jgi:hypothetical protein
MLLLFFLPIYSVNLSANDSVKTIEVKQPYVKKTHVRQVNIEKKDSKNNITLESLLTTLQIEQGISKFTQKKHFTFLNNPIISTGLLKIHKNSVIWQINTPIFSKLVIIEDQVWQLINQSKDKNHTQKNSLEQYQIVASHASVETLIRAVFTGEIDRTLWGISLNDQECLQLLPKDLVLSQAIKYINVCVPDNNNQRFVTLMDAQGNLTEIELNIITNQLSDEDTREFNIHK